MRIRFRAIRLVDDADDDAHCRAIGAARLVSLNTSNMCRRRASHVVEK
jgi:hypothetical protein